jgi:hypothetical protein
MEQGLMSFLGKDMPGSWVRDRTLVRVYDDANKEIAVLDGMTGLTWVKPGPDADWELDTSVFPDGRWVFDGVAVTGDGTTGMIGRQTWHEQGYCSGGDWETLHAELMAETSSPWDYPGAGVVFSTYAERDSRLQVCRACPFYDQLDGTCSQDGAFMPLKTINAGETCPDERWAEAPSWTPDKAAAKLEQAQVGMPNSEEQAAFEAEWEARNVR